jgi:hypothetical protein
MIRCYHAEHDQKAGPHGLQVIEMLRNQRGPVGDWPS